MSTKKLVNDFNVPGHTKHLFRHEDLDRVVDALARQIRKLGRIEAVAACGFSGLIPAVLVAKELGIDLIAIRKASEKARADDSRCNVRRGSPVFRRWVIIDDLISQGETIAHMVRSIRDEKIAYPRPTAILLHSGYGAQDASWGVAGYARNVPIHRVTRYY